MRRRFSISGSLLSDLWRPNHTPAIRVDDFARKNRAWAPYVTIGTLDQCTICAVLIGSRIGAAGRFDRAGVVRIPHRLCHRVILR